MPSPYLQVDHLTKSFGEHVLFEDISFGVAQGQRIGLIAKNGTGKSTLLDILAGVEGYDSGSIVYRSGLSIGYLPQTPTFAPAGTIADLCPSHELQALLHVLGITDTSLPVGQLSGGQQKRVALARVLVGKPDFLILDEPTNHLDLSTIEWLEGELSHSSSTLLMVTHDRYFLDRICSVIMELDDNTVYTYSGNYSYYLAKRQERIDALNAEIARANNLYRYELEKKARQSIRDEHIDLRTQAGYIGNKIIELNDVCFSYNKEAKPLLSHFTYIFSRYEKLGIVGDNGTGKTTFLRLLMGELTPTAGTVDVGTTVRFGYYSQQGLIPVGQQKVIDVVRDIADYIPMSDGSTLSASQLLQNFLFTPKKQYDYVHKLSGGERRRLYLCTVLMRNPNFLILDEPTNDLDILTLQILEEYLRSWKGCLIVVSHDRYFMDKMVDHLLVFDGTGAVRDFPGNYSQYREERAYPQPLPKGKGAASGSNQSPLVQEEKGEATPQKGKGDTPRRMTYKERREFEQLDADIAALEAEKKQLEEALCSGTLTVEALTAASKRLPLLADELDEKSMRWLELSELS